MRHRIAAAILALHPGLGLAEARRMLGDGEATVRKQRLRLSGRVPWRDEQGGLDTAGPLVGPVPVEAVPWRLKCRQCEQVLVLSAKPCARPGGAGWPFSWCPGCTATRR
eukprot:3841894-Alexandrium_andersonii.AAC.1